MYLQTQFSIFLINKPGVLAGVMGALAKAKVNVIALTLMDSMEHGVLRVVCDKPDAARETLSKAYDRWTETDVLILDLPNEPGAFAKMTEHLAAEHVNISYAYSTGGAAGGRTTGVLKVADMKKAMRILKAGPDKAHAKTKARKAARTVKTAPPRRRG